MNYKNAKYINDSGLIDCEIEHPKYGWIPYTLDPNDTDMTINNNELLSAMEKNNDVESYVAPTQEELDSQEAIRVRQIRDSLLTSEVDPIVTNPLRWAELSEEKQTEWINYRNKLLNIPEQEGFPNNVTFPTKPD